MPIPSEIAVLIDRLQALKQQQADLPDLLNCTHALYQQLLQAITAHQLQTASSRTLHVAVIPPAGKQASLPSITPADPSPETTTAPSPLLQEINERIGIKSPSLNDQLKTPATELAETLSYAPVPDLRKAIGINDRFLFITELFAHNHQEYEQAIETLNSCTSWDEARQWITHHLQTRYAWNSDHPAVQAFYEVVKKRFSVR